MRPMLHASTPCQCRPRQQDAPAVLDDHAPDPAASPWPHTAAPITCALHALHSHAPPRPAQPHGRPPGRTRKVQVGTAAEGLRLAHRPEWWRVRAEHGNAVPVRSAALPPSLAAAAPSVALHTARPLRHIQRRAAEWCRAPLEHRVVPVQMWHGSGQSGHRCRGAGRSRGAVRSERCRACCDALTNSYLYIVYIYIYALTNSYLYI